MSPPQRETRHADFLTVQDSRSFKTSTADKTFIPRAIREWNTLPLSLREVRTQGLFKQKLRIFIRENIAVK